MSVALSEARRPGGGRLGGSDRAGPADWRGSSGSGEVQSRGVESHLLHLTVSSHEGGGGRKSLMNLGLPP